MHWVSYNSDLGSGSCQPWKASRHVLAYRQITIYHHHYYTERLECIRLHDQWLHQRQPSFVQLQQPSKRRLRYPLAHKSHEPWQHLLGPTRIPVFRPNQPDPHSLAVDSTWISYAVTWRALRHDAPTYLKDEEAIAA